MKKFRKKYPIWASLIVLLLTLGSSLLGSGALLLLGQFWPGVYDLSEYALQLIAELVMLAVLVAVTGWMGMGRIFTRRGRGFLNSMAPAAAILALYIVAGLEMLILSMGQPLQSGSNILIFLLCMAAVGVTEELAFRGLITGMIYEKYGKSPAGVWLSVVVSGLVFGAMHLTNAFAGDVTLTGVLIQMVVASMLGMCLGAVYLRGGNFWSVAAIHGFMDFCALLDSGIFSGGSMLDTVNTYTAANLLGGLLYGLLALFLLRPYQMSALTVSRENETDTTVKLGIALALLGAMIGAVLVLSI